MYIYMYIYLYIHTFHVYIYVYTHAVVRTYARERGSELERGEKKVISEHVILFV